MRLINNCWRIITLMLVVFTSVPLHAQNGDQILDGIGETSMVSRYIFQDDLRDWSRNGWHIQFQGDTPTFVPDTKFNKVLSMDAKRNTRYLIPIDVLHNLESFSFSFWINPQAVESNQTIFDYGHEGKSRLTLIQQKDKLKLSFGNDVELQSTVIPLQKWSHFTLVCDGSAKQIFILMNNQLVGHKEDVAIDWMHVFNTGKSNNKFVLGNSLSQKNTAFTGLLHDLRIYRVALSNRQIAGIYNAVTKGVRQDQNRMDKVEDNLTEFPLSQAQLYNAYLVKVQDITVETQVGELPRLPSFIQGEYSYNMAGPKVRVIWPAPVDNAEVLKSGQYTITGKIPGSSLTPKAIVTVKGNRTAKVPTIRLESFPLQQVTLTTDAHGQQTKFIENRDKFLKTLASTDPNSFLYMFRNAFGQPQPSGAKPLGVWDSQDTKLRGHATGHYLTALAQAFASTGDNIVLQANFATKITYMVDELYNLSKLSGTNKEGKSITDPLAVPIGQNKVSYDSDLSVEGIRTDYWNWGKGYISAYPPDQFIMLEQGAKYGGQKNQVWAPYYTLHKILAGLLDVYQVTGNPKVLEIAKGMTDWVHVRLNNLPKETRIRMWNTYIAGEFGGMNETLAVLSRITNDNKYLKTAQLFDNIDMFFGNADRQHGLAKNVDSFRGLHSNQHIPQIVGSIEMYRVSNLEEYYKVADNFWYKAVNDYMYSIGGVAGARNPANAECFTREPSSLYENGFSSGGQNETCATYNMLKLTNNLFMYEQKAAYMDYYERALYNHILSSVDEHTPANTYHVPLRPGSIKQFGNPNMTGFTCCNGTAIESNTKLQSAIYHKSLDNKSLYVNLFIPSILEWKENNVRIEQVTNYPKGDNTKLKINGQGKFTIHIRVPSWAKNGFTIYVNGKSQKIKAEPETYIALNRVWKSGDEIEIRMPFQFHLDPVMDQQNIASLFYGPVLLAAQEPEARVNWRKVTFDKNDIGKSIKGDASKLEFSIDGVSFKPFYETYGRHSVYLDVTLK